MISSPPREARLLKKYPGRSTMQVSGHLNELFCIGEGIIYVESAFKSHREVAISTLKVLNLHCNYIEDLRGLPNLASLTELNLSSNRLVTFDLPELSFLPLLEILDISANKLRTLENMPFLSGLKKLSIAHNRIKNVDEIESNAPSLEVLDLRGNLILHRRDLSTGLSGLTSLRELSIGGGKLPNPVSSRASNISPLFEDILSLELIDEKNVSMWLALEDEEAINLCTLPASVTAEEVPPPLNYHPAPQLTQPPMTRALHPASNNESHTTTPSITPKFDLLKSKLKDRINSLGSTAVVPAARQQRRQDFASSTSTPVSSQDTLSTAEPQEQQQQEYQQQEQQEQQQMVHMETVISGGHHCLGRDSDGRVGAVINLAIFLGVQQRRVAHDAMGKYFDLWKQEVKQITIADATAAAAEMQSRGLAIHDEEQSLPSTAGVTTTERPYASFIAAAAGCGAAALSETKGSIALAKQQQTFLSFSATPPEAQLESHSALRETLEATQTRLTQEKARANASAALLSRCELQCRRLRRELEEARTEATRAVARYDSDKIALRTQCEQDVERERACHDVLLDDLDSAKSQLAQALQQCESLRQALSTKTDELEALCTDHVSTTKDLQSRAQELIRSLNDTREQLEECRRDNDKMRADHALELASHTEEMQSLVSLEQAKISELTMQLDKEMARADALMGECDANKRTIETLKAQLLVDTSRREELEKKRAVYKDAIDELSGLVMTQQTALKESRVRENELRDRENELILHLQRVQHTERDDVATNTSPIANKHYESYDTDNKTAGNVRGVRERPVSNHSNTSSRNYGNRECHGQRYETGGEPYVDIISSSFAHTSTTKSVSSVEAGSLQEYDDDDDDDDDGGDAEEDSYEADKAQHRTARVDRKAVDKSTGTSFSRDHEARLVRALQNDLRILREEKMKCEASVEASSSRLKQLEASLSTQLSNAKVKDVVLEDQASLILKLKEKLSETEKHAVGLGRDVLELESKLDDACITIDALEDQLRSKNEVEKCLRRMADTLTGDAVRQAENNARYSSIRDSGSDETRALVGDRYVLPASTDSDVSSGRGQTRHTEQEMYVSGEREQGMPVGIFPLASDSIDINVGIAARDSKRAGATRNDISNWGRAEREQKSLHSTAAAMQERMQALMESHSSLQKQLEQSAEGLNAKESEISTLRQKLLSTEELVRSQTQLIESMQRRETNEKKSSKAEKKQLSKLRSEVETKDRELAVARMQCERLRALLLVPLQATSQSPSTALLDPTYSLSS